jgi:hypothetical protein
MSQARKNLVISPIGDNSDHLSWLSDRDNCTFDMFLIYYGERADFGRAEADYYLSRKGFKWELLDYAAREYRDVLERYDRIWFPDCDVRADTASVNRLFALVEEYKLQLAQPAISAGLEAARTARPPCRTLEALRSSDALPDQAPRHSGIASGHVAFGRRARLLGRDEVARLFDPLAHRP